MACCRVNKCCFCLDHTLGVKLLALFLILAEIIYVVLAVNFVPKFAKYVVVACSFGVISHIFLLVAVFRVSRWFCIPWLIYSMLVVVALCLAAVLLVVIPLGASNQEPDWLVISLSPAGCLIIAGIYLYFWIVVLELFIKLGPLYYMGQVPGAYQYPGPPPGAMMGHQGVGPPPVPVHAVMYDNQGPSSLVTLGGDAGPHSMFATNPNNTMAIYQQHNQPQSLPAFYGPGYQTGQRTMRQY